MERVSWDEYNRTMEALDKGINPSPDEERVLKFVQSHDPGKDARFIMDKGKLKISVPNPWTKPGTGESGIEDLIFEPKLSEARKALGY